MNPDNRPLPSETWYALLRQGVETVAGKAVLAALEAEASAGLLEGLPMRYGPPTAQGLAWRAGRVAWNDLRRHNPAALGLEGLEYWLLPPRRRLSQGLRALVAFCQAGGWGVSLEETAHEWRLDLHAVPAPTADPAHLWCWFLAGLVQEFLAWAGGARVYPLRGLTCAADPTARHPCRLSLGREPLD